MSTSRYPDDLTGDAEPAEETERVVTVTVTVKWWQFLIVTTIGAFIGTSLAIWL